MEEKNDALGGPCPFVSDVGDSILNIRRPIAPALHPFDHFEFDIESIAAYPTFPTLMPILGTAILLLIVSNRQSQIGYAWTANFYRKTALKRQFNPCRICVSFRQILHQSRTYQRRHSRSPFFLFFCTLFPEFAFPNSLSRIGFFWGEGSFREFWEVLGSFGVSRFFFWVFVFSEFFFRFLFFPSFFFCSDWKEKNFVPKSNTKQNSKTSETPKLPKLRNPETPKSRTFKTPFFFLFCISDMEDDNFSAAKFDFLFGMGIRNGSDSPVYRPSVPSVQPRANVEIQNEEKSENIICIFPSAISRVSESIKHLNYDATLTVNARSRVLHFCVYLDDVNTSVVFIRLESDVIDVENSSFRESTKITCNLGRFNYILGAAIKNKCKSIKLKLSSHKMYIIGEIDGTVIFQSSFQGSANSLSRFVDIENIQFPHLLDFKCRDVWDKINSLNESKFITLSYNTERQSLQAEEIDEDTVITLYAPIAPQAFLQLSRNCPDLETIRQTYSKHQIQNIAKLCRHVEHCNIGLIHDKPLHVNFNLMAKSSNTILPCSRVDIFCSHYKTVAE